MGACCGGPKPKIIHTLVNDIFENKKEIKGDNFDHQ